MAHDGGLIALVEGGDLIEIDIPARRRKTLLSNSGANTGYRLKSRYPMVFCNATVNTCGRLVRVRFWISRIRQRF